MPQVSLQGAPTHQVGGGPAQRGREHGHGRQRCDRSDKDLGAGMDMLGSRVFQRQITGRAPAFETAPHLHTWVAHGHDRRYEECLVPDLRGEDDAPALEERLKKAVPKLHGETVAEINAKACLLLLQSLFSCGSCGSGWGWSD